MSRIAICIPHYFKPSDNKKGYGSTRQTARITRLLSFGRCLGSLINLQRTRKNCLFNMNEQAIEHYAIADRKILPDDIQIEITICTNGVDVIDEILEEFSDFVTIKTFELDDPKILPITTRDWLLRNSKDNDNYDLYAYLEDDLVITDAEFFDKQAWFLGHTKGRFCLMPHRYEPIFRRNVGRLLIDGPLRPALIRKFYEPKQNSGRGVYRGETNISFDIPENPHSGLFVVSRSQKEILSKQELPIDGFISPLETAATLTVVKYFSIFKPSIDCSNFLMIEHAHPSFTSFMNQWKHQPLDGYPLSMLIDNG